MKDKKVNQNLKNLILMVVSALVLITATVCWFFMTASNTVEGFNTFVDNPSSSTVFFEAEDTNKNGVIDGTESYVEIKTPNIVTSNMFPGKTYFYKVVITGRNDNMNFGLYFEGIEDFNNLSSQIDVTAKIVKPDTQTVIAATDNEQRLSTLINYDSESGIADAGLLSATGLSRGDYEVYYTLKMTEDATILEEGHNLSINNVSAVLFD